MPKESTVDRMDRIVREEQARYACGLLVAAGFSPSSLRGIPSDVAKLETSARSSWPDGGQLTEYGAFRLRTHGDEALGASDQTLLRAALSTGEIVGGIGDSINFALVDQFLGTRDSLAGIRKESTLENYRQQERGRVRNFPALADLPRGGRANHVSAHVEISSRFRGIRKGLQGQFDDIDLLDFPWLLSEVAQAGAVAARNFLSDMSWKPLLANDDLGDEVPFFDAAHGNTANAALDGTNLAAAMAAMNSQRENGQFTGHRAKYLVVAEERLHTARKLAREIRLDDGDDLIVRSEPRIGSGMTDPVTGNAIAGDSTRWFLFSQMPAVEVALMDPAPRVVTWTADSKLSVGWSTAWTLGSVGIDYRACFRRQSGA